MMVKTPHSLVGPQALNQIYRVQDLFKIGRDSMELILDVWSCQYSNDANLRTPRNSLSIADDQLEVIFGKLEYCRSGPEIRGQGF